MSISNFQIRQGSTVPWLEIQLMQDGIVPLFTQSGAYGCEANQGRDNPIDLTNAIVSFSMKKCARPPVDVTMSGTTEIIDAAKGLVRHKWHPNETAVKGFFYGTFQVKFQDNTILLWPYQKESLIIEIIG